MLPRNTAQTVLVLLLILPLAWIGGSNYFARKKIDELLAKIEGSEIGRVEIFWMNLDTENEINLPVENFKRMKTDPRILQDSFFKVVLHTVNIDDFSNNKIQSGFYQALESISVSLYPPIAIDIRLSVSFYDLNGKEVTALYFTCDGAHGAVDSKTVSFSGEFFDFIKRHYVDPQKQKI